MCESGKSCGCSCEAKPKGKAPRAPARRDHDRRVIASKEASAQWSPVLNYEYSDPKSTARQHREGRFQTGDEVEVFELDEDRRGGWIGGFEFRARRKDWGLLSRGGKTMLRPLTYIRHVDARRERERDVVITDREGRPFDRPRRSDFKTDAAYLDAYDDYRGRIRAAMENRGMQLSLERDASYEAAKRHAGLLDANARVRRDPVGRQDPLIVGAVYHLEWDTTDEGDEGTYVYRGVYEPSGADMFRRVSSSPKRRVTLYLFPHEIRYLELLLPPRAITPRVVPPAPQSGTRRRAAPKLSPGRVLMRPARNTSRLWDQGIVGSSVARVAQFQGFRNIDNMMLGVWSANGVLYAQPPRHV